jgi:NADP-dependent 3-hydroxy acid dehydrogenase YdfG
MRFDNVHGTKRIGAAVDLKGAVVVVTGASSGIGEATAVAFAKRGARIVLTARRMDRLQLLAQRIEDAGGTALAMKVDVTEVRDLHALPGLVEEVFARPCDVLVNNAGVPGRERFQELSYEQIQRVVDVNLLGVLYGSRAFLPGMLARGHGHVINVASLAGLFAAPGAGLYSATKHAVVAFSESTDYDTRRRGVRVTAFAPGFVETEGFPQEGVPGWAVLPIERVAESIVTIARDGIAPLYALPRWMAPMQAFRALTPSLYRWGVGQVRRAGSASTPRSR